MATTDSKPAPKKNAAYRVYFGYYKSDGTLITSTSSPSSQVVKDAAAVASTSNAAVQCGTTGIFYCDLLNTEMNYDCVVYKFSDATTGAVPVVIPIYPQETGDISVDMTSYLGVASPAADTAGYPKVTIKSGTGTGEISLAAGLLRLSATGVDDILDEVVEGTTTMRQMLRGYASALLGKASGLGTTTAVYRDVGDTKARITATVDTDGNRTAITTDLT